MDFKKKRTKRYPILKKALWGRRKAIEKKDGKKYPEVVESNDIIEVDLEDNHNSKRKLEEDNENPGVTEEELERAKKMYESGEDPFEEERNQAILRYVQSEGREVIPDQNIERPIRTKTKASKSRRTQPSIDTPSPKHLRCMKCRYTTAESSNFINHWLKHRTQSYEKVQATAQGKFACEEETCRVKRSSKRNLLTHVQSHNLCTYQCDFCDYLTYFRRDFLQHSALHDIFECTLCDLQSTKRIFVQDHLVNPWICSKCGFAAHHWFVINKHIFSHSNSFFVCEVCSFVTTNDTEIQQHRLIHKKHFVPCKMCGFKTKNIDILALHYECAHSTTREAVDKTLEPLSKCKFCDCEFTHRAFLGRHEAFHLNNGPSFECSDCAEFSAYTEDVGETIYLCPYCTVRKYNFQHFHSHILQEHPDELQSDGYRYRNKSNRLTQKGSKNSETVTAERIEELQDNEEPMLNITKCGKGTTSLCPICFDITTGTANFERHLTDKHCLPTERIELIKKKKLVTVQYQCDFCYYMTLSEQDYTEHRKNHVIFKCTECSFEASKQLFVEDHIKDTYTCQQCDFKAHHWLPVKKHTFKHTNTSSPILNCTLCKFTTRNSATILEHRATHEKNELQCHICIFKTKDIICLQRHFIECHETILELKLAPNEEEDELHKCEFCECKFKHPIYLHRHQTIHRENGPNFKCSQCFHTKSLDKDKDPWTHCPYCPYYSHEMGRIMDHMARKHEDSLEIEGYRFKKSDANEKSDGAVEGTLGLLNYSSKVIGNPDETYEQKIQSAQRHTKNLEEVERNEEVMSVAQKDVALVQSRQLLTIPTGMTKHKGNDIKEDNQAVVHPQVQASHHETVFDTRTTDIPEERIEVLNTERITKSGVGNSGIVITHVPADETLITKSRLSTSIRGTTRKEANKVVTIDCTRDRQAMLHPQASQPKRKFNARITDILTKKIKAVNPKHAKPSGENENTSQARSDQTIDIQTENIQGKSRSEEKKRDSKIFETLDRNVIFEKEKNKNLNKASEPYESINTNIEDIPYFLLEDRWYCSICIYSTKLEYFIRIHRCSNFDVKTTLANRPGDDTQSDVIDLTHDDYDDKAGIKREMPIPEPAELTKPNVPSFCHICHYISENTQDLAQHMEASHGPQKTVEDVHEEKEKESTKRKCLLSCPICFHTSENNDQLEEHMTESHASYETVKAEEDENKVLEIEIINHCPVCFYTSHSQDLLDEHITTNHNTAEVEINLEVVDGMHELLEEEVTENKAICGGAESVEDFTQEETWCCSVCSHTSDSLNALREHISDMHETENEETISEGAPKTKLLSCKVCFFTTALGLTDLLQHTNLKHPHYKSNTLKIGWNCPVCEYTSNSEDSLNEHLAVKHRLKRSKKKVGTKYQSDHVRPIFSKVDCKWYCSGCNYNYIADSKIIIEQHIALKHPAEQEEWCCLACSYNASIEYMMKEHLHTKNLTNMSTKDTLPSKYVRKWCCDLCTYSTTKNARFLTEHKATQHKWHSSRAKREKVPCKQAGCRFEASSVDELSVHMTQHLQSTMKEVLTYTCERCGFGSVSKSIFSNHKRRCVKIIWYKCYHCDYKRKEKSDLRDHLTYMHKYTYKRKGGFGCKKCGFRTNNKDLIDLHFKRNYSMRCVEER